MPKHWLWLLIQVISNRGNLVGSSATIERKKITKKPPLQAGMWFGTLSQTTCVYRSTPLPTPQPAPPRHANASPKLDLALCSPIPRILPFIQGLLNINKSPSTLKMYVTAITAHYSTTDSTILSAYYWLYIGGKAHENTKVQGMLTWNGCLWKVKICYSIF